MSLAEGLDLSQLDAGDLGRTGAFIEGSWTALSTNDPMRVVNPATGTLLAEVDACSASDVDAAVAAAEAAGRGSWSSWTPYERQRLLVRLADALEAAAGEFALLETLDMGAPLTRTRAAVARAVQMLHWCAANAVTLRGSNIPNSLAGQVLSITRREPIGVVGAIIPWNFPIVSAVWKLGPALATGCTVVLKPAEDAPLVPLALAGLCHKVGVPPGVFNVVPGLGEVTGDALTRNPRVRKLSFTGSRQVGSMIMRNAAETLARLTLELGGKSPNIVFSDADLGKAATGAVTAAFANAGQVCSAGTRLFVQSSVYDDFGDMLAAAASKVQVGEGLDERSEVGPLISEQHLARVRSLVNTAKSLGAEVAEAGAVTVPDVNLGGYFMPPTIVRGVADEAEIARDEIFGPVLTVLRFDDVDEVVTRANNSPYGLGAGVWTQNISIAHTVANRLDCGAVWVNGYNKYDVAVPFGGTKGSGFGREQGVEVFDSYLETKAVWIDHT